MPGSRVLGVRVPRNAAPALTTLALAAARGGCGGQEQETTTSLKGFTRTPAPQVAQLRLPDHAPGRGGRPLALRADPGGLLLVYFGYTSCPDVCPTTFADVRRARELLPAAERERLTVAMVTVDPRRDTAAVLNDYLRHFFPRWHALRTTDPAALARAEKAFGASHEIGPRNAEGGYDVAHSALLYAVDERGAIRVEWPFGTPPDDIAADLRVLLRERAGTAA
jgi:protein SCO1/2